MRHIHTMNTTTQVGWQCLVDALRGIQFEAVHDFDEFITALVFPYARVV